MRACTLLIETTEMAAVAICALKQVLLSYLQTSASQAQNIVSKLFDGESSYSVCWCQTVLPPFAPPLLLLHLFCTHHSSHLPSPHSLFTEFREHNWLVFKNSTSCVVMKPRFSAVGQMLHVIVFRGQNLLSRCCSNFQMNFYNTDVVMFRCLIFLTGLRSTDVIKVEDTCFSSVCLDV